jgi:putative acyl-CoA dehydrogenase
MVQLTRLDCAISSAGMMRMALAQAVHHARHRSVFERTLIDQPLMGSVLADLALDSEAAVAAMMRLCRSYDLAASDPSEAVRARVLTPVLKYWLCKSAPAFIYEAMECLGGNGYVEESVLPRLYREAPVNAIWEGSGNVVSLDLLRAVAREGEAARELLAGLARTTARLPGCLDALKSIERMLGGSRAESEARRAVERLALVVAADALQISAPEIAPIFTQARLVNAIGRSYGTGEISAGNTELLLSRAL